MIETDGIILDVDGTIWNTTSIVADAWNKAIDETFPDVKKVTDKILQTQFGKTMDVIADNLFSVLSEADRKILLIKCCEYEQKAVEDNQFDITYPEVVDTIKQLSEHKKLFIVSNCHAGYIELVIKKTGITEAISDFECFGNNNLPKDKNIRLICERNKLLKPVYVGDTSGDADACALANVPFIWATYGFGLVEEKKYIQKISSFSELKNIIC